MYGTKLEPLKVDEKLSGKTDAIQVGDLELNVIHTPGHTPGSISMLVRQAGWAPILLVGDLTYETASLEQDIVPATGDRDMLLATFAKVRRLKERLPGLAIVASHDFAAEEAVARATNRMAQTAEE